MKRFTRRQFAFSIGAAILGVSASGCGTVLYPERRGQPAGRLDWSVVAMDAIGLIFFFVPGVIAFAVDFMTGAIYLPYDGYGSYRYRRIYLQINRVSPPNGLDWDGGQPSLVEWAPGE